MKSAVTAHKSRNNSKMLTIGGSANLTSGVHHQHHNQYRNLIHGGAVMAGSVKSPLANQNQMFPLNLSQTYDIGGMKGLQGATPQSLNTLNMS